jgi:hypothetical protein
MYKATKGAELMENDIFCKQSILKIQRCCKNKGICIPLTTVCNFFAKKLNRKSKTGSIEIISPSSLASFYATSLPAHKAWVRRRCW